ncbi:MAG: 16S rRNA (uracil(1498)-N(3))-methyltransferase [Phycisphaerae bacterium]|nr:16S rRNA (uracil(1498)-N(3))-methyltransferase [Phycisphaerae bacterium]
MCERRFFCQSLAVGRLALPPDEARHARTVLRIRQGEPVELFDGRGGLASGTVQIVNRSTVEIRVERLGSAGPHEQPLPVTIAVAMPKGPRQDVLIEKCTELGAKAIWPVITQRSVVRPKPARATHWHKVSIAAAKQSGRLFLPEIPPPEDLPRILTRLDRFDLTLFGSTDAGTTPLLSCLDSWKITDDVLVLIGPEGGFTDDEQDALTRAGTRPVSLCPSVLRVETAAVAALAVLNAVARRIR